MCSRLAVDVLGQRVVVVTTPDSAQTVGMIYRVLDLLVHEPTGRAPTEDERGDRHAAIGPGSRRAWSVEERAHALALVDGGASRGEASRQTGVPVATIAAWRRRNGVQGSGTKSGSAASLSGMS